MTFSLYNRFRDLEKVRVDSSAIEGYLGATSSDGVLRTGSNLSYTDGGNYITLDISSTATPTLAGLSLTGELDITKATSLLIDLNPSFTGTGEVINITPSAPLASVDAEWDGIVINGALLDPGSGATGAFIHGIHIDFSGIDMTYNPHVDGIHIQSPTCLCGSHAFHAEGEVHVNMDTTAAIASQSYTALDIVIDTVGATGGLFHALDVARVTGGTLSTVALGTHTGIDVINQLIGTATAFDKVWEYNGGWVDVTSACAGTDGDVALWDAQDGEVYFGQATTFDEIECTWTTPATKDMHFTFWYSTGTSTYTEFDPADDTRGGQTNGLIRFLASDIGSWATGTVNGTTTKYWIKIIRTRLAGTAPTEDTVKYIKGTTYEWDKVGAVTSLSLSTGALTASGTVTIPTALTGLIRADSGVLSVDTDVTDLVSAATTSAAGKSELAIIAEVNTGTDTVRTITPDALEGSNYGKKAFCIAVHEHDDAVTVANGSVAFTVPAEMDTMSLVDVVVSVHDKGITNTTDVQIRRRRAGSDADMLGTVVTLGDEFFVSDGVIEADNDDVATGDSIYIDVDAIHSGTAPNGLSVTCIFAVTTVGV